jgi:hypothetical protein
MSETMGYQGDAEAFRQAIQQHREIAMKIGWCAGETFEQALERYVRNCTRLDGIAEHIDDVNETTVDYGGLSREALREPGAMEEAEWLQREFLNKAHSLKDCFDIVSSRVSHLRTIASKQEPPAPAAKPKWTAHDHLMQCASCNYGRSPCPNYREMAEREERERAAAPPVEGKQEPGAEAAPPTQAAIVGENATGVNRPRAAAGESTELRAALENLLNKLDQVEEDTKGIFVMAQIHGKYYNGANWSKEYAAGRAALAASQERSA